MRKIETDGLGIFSAMAFAVSITLCFVYGCATSYVVAAIIFGLLFLGSARYKTEDKHIGNLYIFQGETDGNVTVGLEILEKDVNKLISDRTGLMTVVDCRDMVPLTNPTTPPSTH